jgi:hypothetical protein
LTCMYNMSRVLNIAVGLIIRLILSPSPLGMWLAY